MATKTIGDYIATVSIDGTNHYLLIQPGNASTAYNKINRNVFLGVTGQPADISTVQSLTNKTLDNTNTVILKDTLFTLQDDGDTTKQAKFQLSGITTATTRTYTLPNASSTLADIATAQTFTNKTLTAPAISGGTIDNSTITVDSIGEHTVANGVTIDGLNIKDGALNTNNSVVSANITDAAVTPAKLLAGTGSGWTWQSFVPSFTNFTTTSATISGTYIQIGKTVIGEIYITAGAGTAFGTGAYFTPPVTQAAKYNSGRFKPVGNISFQDSGTAIFNGVLMFDQASASNAIIFYVNGSAATYTNPTSTTATVPFTIAAGDTMGLQFMYEAA